MSTEGKIVVWAGGQLLKAFKDRAVTAHAKRLENDFTQLLIEIEGLGLDGEQVETRLARTDPGVDDILRDFFVLMLGIRGGKAKSAVAKLTAHYFFNQKSSDRFFRRFGRLLEQCEDPVLDCVSSLVTYLLKHNDGKDIGARLRADEAGNKLISLSRYQKAEVSEPYNWDADYFEAFWLMKQFGFGKELPSGIGTTAGPLSMHVRIEAWPDFALMHTFLR